MRKFCLSLWRADSGQDLIEYTLLLAFVALVAAALIVGAGNSVSGLWSIANTRLENVNAAAGAS